MKILSTWENAKRKAFEGALKLGGFQGIVEARGGTGELREPLTHKQYLKRKNRMKMAKASRKRNR